MTITPAPARTGGGLLARAAQPVLLLAVMWVVRALDDALPGSWNQMFGLISWSFDGLDGILLSPGLHGDWSHLVSNSVPFLILGLLVALDGVGRFWGVTVIIALIGGVGTWIVNAPGTITVGASGLVFGYFGYLLIRAFVARSLGHGILYALIALVIAGLYGGSMWVGIFSAAAGISWQAHLFGAIGGAVAAIATRPKRIARA
ncbi:rhomboid family intramembrane serine protease [Microbacterium sediminis]|uniref:Rhomboid family intramembrane serine protease n=1 Tax=Microbacterium sediminis TaxID=904291 RepID=A0A1B9NBC8_9MICO|nr:rhomboid family intramembrane serine protease [Microbacterium sediminis]OCG73918.1 rhomboid family intramembrane serine protease [Microbacterium sediminis]QBR74670.1 rhomboid family intramembrane serine protease [Microbacterium sediminis]